VPSFAPEILRRVKLGDAMKAKKLREALQQLAEEGVVQLFRPLDGSPAIVGVVGALQLDVLATDLFDRKAAAHYDERFRKISPIRDNLDFLIRLVLDDLPAEARVLCVGIGTGTEIVALANARPSWRFTAVEPSAPMLDVCRGKLGESGLSDRCELFHGYLSALPESGAFDAVLCLLVTQFVTDASERQRLFDDMATRLKPGGYLVNAEISDDMSSAEFLDIAEKWKSMHRYAGATAEEAENAIATLCRHVAVVPPPVIEDYLRNSGFSRPVQFFQSLLIRAWYARKD
jgi:tRNA (cmo5U34)-methyltransferase